MIMKEQAQTTDMNASNVTSVIPPNTTLYLVCAVQKQQAVEMKAYGIKQNLPLTWADGMIGVLPVFIDREKAEKYANGNFSIWEVKSTTV